MFPLSSQRIIRFSSTAGSATQVTIKLVRKSTINKGARVMKVISASQVKQEVSHSRFEV